MCYALVHGSGTNRLSLAIFTFHVQKNIKIGQLRKAEMVRF